MIVIFLKPLYLTQQKSSRMPNEERLSEDLAYSIYYTNAFSLL